MPWSRTPAAASAWTTTAATTAGRCLGSRTWTHAIGADDLPLDDTEHRLIDLESRFSFQEETIRELSEALVRQQQRIDRLEASLKVVAEQVQRADAGDDAPQMPKDERPPHY
ncbi:MAG: SlyX family protein [Gammaproteobacteria bacterium]|nr:SlyX family protein [Gammaproteobacteria bacterium]